MFARPRLAGAVAFAISLATAHAAAVAGDGKAALDRVPQDYGVVMSINVDRAKGSVMFKDAMAIASKNPDFQSKIDMLKAQAGFDVTRDVKTIIIGVNTDAAATGGGDQKAVILVEGKFDLPKIMKFAKTQAAGKAITEQAYAGVKYYAVEDAEVAVIAPYMVVTPKGHMKNVIDVAKGKAASVKKNAGFMKMLGTTDTSKDFWAVFMVPAMQAKMIAAQLGHGIDAVGASLDVAKGLNGKVAVATQDPAAAQAIAGIIKAQLPQIQPMAQGMGLGDAFKRLVIASDKNMVTVAFDLTVAELTTIKNMLGQFIH